jgi:bifunctional UDP-N-acetylglucosamine pyrophosphorylase/glucosamine-1-phosphate N-acetyltransferase
MSSGAFAAGRDRLVFVVGHKQEQIREYFGSMYGDVPITYAEQSRALGTGHAVSVGFDAAQAPAESVVVWLADAYVPPQVFRDIAAGPFDNAVTIARHDDGEPYGHRVDIDPEARTAARSWKGSSPFVEVGCWKLTPSVVGELTSPGAASGDGEYRALQALQRLIEGGLELGYVEAPAWVHLGGTKPTPEVHLRRVFETLVPQLISGSEAAVGGTAAGGLGADSEPAGTEGKRTP